MENGSTVSIIMACKLFELTLKFFNEFAPSSGHVPTSPVPFSSSSSSSSSSYIYYTDDTVVIGPVKADDSQAFPMLVERANTNSGVGGGSGGSGGGGNEQYTRIRLL
ncbi:hypothetical protein M0802_006567 [Mischocyttarus mexicanus]|nr:hypothetical protein M0802_006567 [Mischocyttarus mexicanus]